MIPIRRPRRGRRRRLRQKAEALYVLLMVYCGSVEKHCQHKDRHCLGVRLAGWIEIVGESLAIHTDTLLVGMPRAKPILA
jgi:hypothetical protein